MTYRLNQQATDILVTAESSFDLTPGSWTDVYGEIPRVDMGTYWLVTVVDSVTLSSATQRFMRLRVEK